jgi:TolB-like protein/Tfp pilus assembly protein PilF
MTSALEMQHAVQQENAFRPDMGGAMKRKLASILAADVAGYSRLMEVDEERTHGAFRLCRATIAGLVAKHGGRLFGGAGDSIMAEFGSPVEAVRAGLDIQNDLAERRLDLPEGHRMQFRIGINLGDVMVDRDQLFGDGVNVAARLEALADPGGLCISASVHEHVAGKLRLNFDDQGMHDVKNMTKPVHVFRARLGTTTAENSSAVRPLRPEPSIAVLPFDNMSGDPEQEYFSDGITEDIITELSRFQQLFVIARHSSFQYRDKAGDVLRIGRDLNVQYVVEGSIRRCGDHIRISAQLIDSVTGVHIWVERYDSSLTDLFVVQDEVTKTIAAALAVRVEEEDWAKARRKPPESMRAYDFWLRGKRSLDLWTREGNLEARRLFEMAVEAEPDYARAHAGLAFTYEWGGYYSAWDADPKVSLKKAEHHAKKAVVLDDTDPVPHVILGWIYHARREFLRGRQHFDRAMVINPNDADTLANSALALAWRGEGTSAIELARAAIRLNPRYPNWYQCFLAGCYMCAQRYPEAIAIWERIPDATPETRAFLSAACVFVGRLQEARRHMAEFMRTYSQHWAGEPSARSLRDLFEFASQVDIDHLIDGMRQAGLPE